MATIKKLNIGLAAGCGSCNTNSTIDDFPTFILGVNDDLNYQRGGITGLAFNKCNAPFTDPTDQVEWQTKIDGVPPVVGPPPVPAIPPSLVVLLNCFVGFEKSGEPQTVTVGACQTILQSGINYSVTGTVTADNLSSDVFKFMKHLQSHPTDYTVSLITCDNKVYPFQKVGIQAVHNIEGTVEGSTNWALTLTYNTTQDQEPYVLTWDITDLSI